MKRFLIVAGEVSGDLHGSNLVKALKKLEPEIELFGIGGDRMKDAGVELTYHINSLSFMGFIEVLKHIPYLKKVKRKILQLVDEKNPDTAILIDYPGFNLSLAKELHKKGIKIFYYISPQLWAWGKNRIELIKKIIHKMIVVFPFEEKMYHQNGIDAVFVGHPLIDVIENYQFIPKEKFFQSNSFDMNKKLVAIFPGSRKQEIQKILPEIFKAIKKLRNDFPLNFAIAGINSIDKSLYQNIVGDEIPIVINQNYELMKYADLGIIKSGTSTLEAALFELPFFVVYKTSYISYLIGKNLIQIDKISLANIVAEEKIVNELIQHDCNSEKIYSEMKELILNEQKRNEIKLKLKKVKELLGDAGASEKAARVILSEI
ncbi:MAG: lipid-A-disaccharide synthase [Ignavibacteria bacterium]|nr:lipid-A-disaccharide synthase [Ignavibacteria bacterium]